MEYKLFRVFDNFSKKFCNTFHLKIFNLMIKIKSSGFLVDFKIFVFNYKK